MMNMRTASREVAMCTIKLVYVNENYAAQLMNVNAVTRITSAIKIVDQVAHIAGLWV
jgi:hypothetical protein